MENTVIFIAEMIGTVAFASSGAMLAIRKNLDIFGVLVLALTVAVGGGVLRDVMLGLIPPVAFRDPSYALVAMATAIALFLLIYFRQDVMNSPTMAVYEMFMNYCDAIGLGIFTVVGVYTAYTEGYRHPFFLLFLGLLTGIGGGVLRDVLANTLPFILHKHIYAVAALAGALVCVQMIEWNLYLAMAAGAGVVIFIRLLAIHLRWSLPKPIRQLSQEKK